MDKEKPYYAPSRQDLPIRTANKKLLNLLLLTSLIRDYNLRDLTFPGDALFGFAGIESWLSRRYLKGGSISGIPAIFFSIGLLWTSHGFSDPQIGFSVKRRVLIQSDSLACLPSWSWAGWQGHLDLGAWTIVHPFLPYNDDEGRSLRRAQYFDRAYPTVQWSWHNDLDGTRHQIQEEIYRYQATYLNGAPGTPCPPGWNRKPITGSRRRDPRRPFRHSAEKEDEPEIYYVHSSFPEAECWYPLPLPDLSIEATHMPNHCRFNSCCTRRARLQIQLWTKWAGRQMKRFRGLLETPDGKILGLFDPHCAADLEAVGSREQPLLEFIEITRGSFPFRSDDEAYNHTVEHLGTSFGMQKEKKDKIMIIIIII